jgi:hypothetical protein
MVFSLSALMFACNGDDNTDTPDNKEKEAPYIDYKSATDFWFPWQAGDTVIAVVDVNGAYRATVAEGGGWCTVSDIAVNSFVIHYAENRIAADRTTKITLSLEGVDDIEIVVSQRGPEPELVIDSAYAELTAPYQGLDTAVLVDVNGVYRVEVETGKEWCQIETLTDINFAFGASSSTVPHRFRFSISQNSELEIRSVKVGVLLTYRDSTVRFEFVVNQNPTPILLATPAEETVIEKAGGFPYTFSWRKTGDIPSYSIAISTNSEFPEEATNVITAGDVDSYVLQLDDVAELIKIGGHFSTLLYWKVTPTDTTINIATETKTFYVKRSLVASYPLTFFGGTSSWIAGPELDDAGNTWWQPNAGQSSRRTWITTPPLAEPLPSGKIYALAYEYKTSHRNPEYEYETFNVYHFAGEYNGDWIIDGPEITCPFTDEWLPIEVPLTAKREWGGTETRVTLFIRPMVVTTNNNNISGMRHYVKNLRVVEYE